MAPAKRKANDALKSFAKQPRRPETLKYGIKVAEEAEKDGGGRRNEVSKRAVSEKKIATPAYLKVLYSAVPL